MRPRDVATTRLHRTGLAVPIDGGPARVVETHLAMQAQDFGPAKWSIGQRLSGSTDVEVERAFTRGSILRTHVLRPTWHLVARRDLRWLLSLSGPRVQKGLQPRYRQLGLDGRTRSRAETVIARALLDGDLTRREVNDVLRRSRIDTEGQRLPHLLIHCELESLICSGARRGNDQTYALFDSRVPNGRRLDRDRAVTELVRRYLRGHGPATVKDMSWWSGLTVSDVKSGLGELEAELATARVDDKTLWWLDEAKTSSDRDGRVRLLQAYDELVVGYTESRYLGDPRAAEARAAYVDRRLPSGVLLSGTRVAGHWRRSVTDRRVEVRVLLYAPLRGAAKAALEEATDDLGRFVGRPVQVTTGVIEADAAVARPRLRVPRSL